jgi:hypothetical protein
VRQGGQPGWVKMTTVLGMQPKTPQLVPALQIFLPARTRAIRAKSKPCHLERGVAETIRPGPPGKEIHSGCNSISVVIFAVFDSICETEQYFSCESRTASSTALRETFPATR